MRAVYWTLRRELHATLRAPIVYLVGGLFLVVQGIAFAGLVGTLSDPRHPALLGELLEGQLAGTLLTWVLQLVVLTLLGMRTIADDKRSGAWELLLTAQVSERAAVIGKWLAAVALYALLWVPTLAYLVVVAAFRADRAAWDIAAIATGYLGAIALGAALLAWAVAASAVARGSLTAGALGFALLVGLFLVGELPALWPGLAGDHPTVAAVLGALSLRDHLTRLARGELAAGTVVLIAGLAITGLSLAVAFACVGRRRGRELRARFAATIGFAVIAVLAGTWCARHPHAWDVSATGRNSLDPATRDTLAALSGPAKLTIIEPTLGALEPIYDEVDRVAALMATAQPALAVARVDPALAPGGLTAVARVAGLAEHDLASGGAIIVDVGERRRVVDLFAIATIRQGAEGAIGIERLAIEQSITGALRELADGVPVHACATAGHAELSLEVADGKGADWTAVAARLRGEGIAVETLEPAAPIPARCDVAIVAGPGTPLAADEALAVQRFVRGGGGLLVAAASRTVAGAQLATTGLEAVLADDGLGLPFAIAIDPTLAVRELPGALLVTRYPDHQIASSGSAGESDADRRGDAIDAGFDGARATLWFQPRVVTTGPGAVALISATAASWGERDLEHGPPTKSAEDLAGPVALAALGAKHRVIATGSAESMATSMLAGGASAGDLWLARAVRFLAGKPLATPLAAPAPAQLRLVMSDGERRAVIALSVAGIPLAWALLGGAILILRRRR